MPLPFPKMHIAESVINRIFNALDDLPPLPAMEMPAPSIPDPAALGGAIEEGSEVPVPPVAAPPENALAAEQGMLESSMTGGSPFDGAIIGALG